MLVQQLTQNGAYPQQGFPTCCDSAHNQQHKFQQLFREISLSYEHALGMNKRNTENKKLSGLRGGEGFFCKLEWHFYSNMGQNK